MQANHGATRRSALGYKNRNTVGFEHSAPFITPAAFRMWPGARESTPLVWVSEA